MYVSNDSETTHGCELKDLIGTLIGLVNITSQGKDTHSVICCCHYLVEKKNCSTLES